MVYKVIKSGSDGNAVLYHNSILVDCGVPFSLVKPYLNSVQIVLLTHAHQDHLNLSTLWSLAKERPALRIGCCDWLGKQVEMFRNVDIYEIGREYDYGSFSVVPVKLYHDIPNCGYRIFKDNYRIFHATDTAHLNGITAKNYDLYCIESNYDEDLVFNEIDQNKEAGVFDYRSSSINSHLSEQQARQFIFENHGENYEVLRLHETKII